MNTPTPLTIQETPNDLDFYCNINDGLGETICSVYVHPKSDIRASEIVRSVNYNDRLVECLKYIDCELRESSIVDRRFLSGRIQQLLTEIKESK